MKDPLKLAASAEVVSLVILLLNLATVHWSSVSSLIGPAHGCAYLFVVLVTARRHATLRMIATAMIPAIGGLLVMRREPASGQSA